MDVNEQIVFFHLVGLVPVLFIAAWVIDQHVAHWSKSKLKD